MSRATGPAPDLDAERDPISFGADRKCRNLSWARGEPTASRRGLANAGAARREPRGGIEPIALAIVPAAENPRLDTVRRDGGMLQVSAHDARRSTARCNSAWEQLIGRPATVEAHQAAALEWLSQHGRDCRLTGSVEVAPARFEHSYWCAS
jgi:hypothetical protein